MSEREIKELEERLARLEAQSRRRGATNMVGAAQHTGFSEETLRRLHAAGDGPRRTRKGLRSWSYRYADLDTWLAERAKKSA